ncbi:MAG TPA: mycothiol system anti-sigma-R factor [Actinomycetota bacterium]|jgi:mycothiol system anti-sigma-R factor
MDDGETHCDETLREVEAYLDGELDPSLSRSISHHLSDCSPCMQRAEFRKHLKELIHDKCAEREVPPDLSERIRALLHATPDDPTTT